MASIPPPPTKSATLQQSDPVDPAASSPSIPTVASPSQARSTEGDPAVVPFSHGEPNSSDEKPARLPIILEEKPLLKELNELPKKKPGEGLLPPVSSYFQGEINRTAHEASVPTRSAKPSWSVTSDDLERLIKDSIALPKQDSRISGRPLRLLDALSFQEVLVQPEPGVNQPLSRYQRQPIQNGQTVRGQNPVTTQMLFHDPQAEQKRIFAYWRLAQSLGQYNLTRQLIDFWALLPAQPGDEALFRTEKSSANSLLCEARVTLVADQHDLVEVADLVTQEELPLPSDPPHVGTYFTHFEKMFAGKPAPSLGRRLDAILPLCREVVESRACSTLTARNAAKLLADEYAAGRCTFAKLASAVTKWREEHQAFLRAAYVYNHNICEYVVSVSGVPTDPGTLVTMLIRPTYPVNSQAPSQTIGQLPEANGETPAVNEPSRLSDRFQTPRPRPSIHPPW